MGNNVLLEYNRCQLLTFSSPVVKDRLLLPLCSVLGCDRKFLFYRHFVDVGLEYDHCSAD